MADYFVHEKAIVETNAIGRGTRVWAFVHILKNARIGRDVNICDYCFIENNVIIGNNVTIKSGVYLWDGITIEDDIMIGPAAVFTNDRWPRSKNSNYHQEKIVLKTGSSIGANATILPGITIGLHALVGAGSVVTRDVPNFALVYGNPAAFKGYICICGQKLVTSSSRITCICGRAYKYDRRLGVSAV